MISTTVFCYPIKMSYDIFEDFQFTLTVWKNLILSVFLTNTEKKRNEKLRDLIKYLFNIKYCPKNKWLQDKYPVLVTNS